MVIAAITSCTNTSNPQVMVAAGIIAQRAVERGLHPKPWVKTTLAPGSRVVMDYLDRAGLTAPLAEIGFDLVGFGCTTCIGNSGPLLPGVAEAVHDQDLSVVSVLSGNRNFEGRIHPDVRMNYLASPPLVVAYALAGTMDIDLTTDPLGDGRRRPAGLPGRPVAHGRRGHRGHPDLTHLGHVPPAVRRRLRRRRAVAVGGHGQRQHLRLGPGLDLRAPARPSSRA